LTVVYNFAAVITSAVTVTASLGDVQLEHVKRLTENLFMRRVRLAAEAVDGSVCCRRRRRLMILICINHCSWWSCVYKAADR